MEKKTVSNQSIEKVFQIIELLAETGKPMRLNDISEKCSIPSATALRILSTMVQTGYAVQDAETSLYSLSFRLVSVGNKIRENTTLNQIVHPYLREVSLRANTSSALGIPAGNCAVFIDEVINTQHMIRIYHHLGTPFPMHSLAVGKTLLAYMSRERRERFFSEAKFAGITPNTVSNRTDLEEQLENIRKNGYALNDQESALGMRCVAVPIFNSDNQIIAAMSISGTIYEISGEKVPSVASMMLSVSRRLMNECGGILSALDYPGI